MTGVDAIRRLEPEGSGDDPAGAAAVIATVDTVIAGVYGRRADPEIVGAKSARLTTAMLDFPAIERTFF